MSGRALKAWSSLPAERWAKIEATRCQIPEKRRPSKYVVELVAFIVAGAFLDMQGYADLTFRQIAERCHTLTESTVKACLGVLTSAGELVTVRRATRGLTDRSGRAPRRVFLCYDPCNLIPGTLEPLVERSSCLQTPSVCHEQTMPKPNVSEFDRAYFEGLLVDGNLLQKNAAKIWMRTVGATN